MPDYEMQGVRPGQEYNRAHTKSVIVGIDASRSRSGGAISHLRGILFAEDPREHGVASVHVWSYKALLDLLPDAPWLIRHSPPALERSLPQQVWWQHRSLERELVGAGCTVLLSTDAGSVCRFNPGIVMSRDMLSFEGSEMQRYPLWSYARFRLALLRNLQVRSLRQATGALFLTRYASTVIQRYTGPLGNFRIIPHGIGEEFRAARCFCANNVATRTTRFLYVSNADLYKHQWNVVSAISKLRKSGLDVSLTLLGGASGPASARVRRSVREADPRGEFIQLLEAVPHAEIPRFLGDADAFVFASSCENMPNTLIEAMAAALPIASSDRGPMPEVLQDGGVYFDPEDSDSIALALSHLASDRVKRETLGRRAAELASSFSWSRCAAETWAFLRDVADLPRS